MVLDKLLPLIWKAIYILGGVLLLIIIYKILAKKYHLPSSGKQIQSKKSTLQGSDLTVSKNPDGFIFGRKGWWIWKKKVFQTYMGEGHIAIFGGSGEGKTSALLIPSLRAWKGPFFCIDISGDINTNVPCENKCILAPDDPDNSMVYNVFDQIDKEKDVDEQHAMLEQLVNLIVAMPPNAKGAEEYFLRTARKIFLAAMVTFYDAGYDFIEICKKVFFSDLKTLFNEILATGHELGCGYIQSMAGENEVNVNGAKSSLDDHIKIFADNKKLAKILHRPASLNGAAEPYIAPSDLEEAHIFLVVPDYKQEFYSLFLNLVVSQILEYISHRKYDRNKDKRILLALDEFASLRHLEILGPFRKFRKNGANICVLTQSLADLDLVYSVNERKAILDNAKYTVVLSAQDPDTQRYFSDRVGKVDAVKKSTTSSKSGDSTSTSHAEEYAIRPDEWTHLGKSLVVIHRGGYAKLRKNFYFER